MRQSTQTTSELRPTHDRRHAGAQTVTQETEQLYSRRAAICGLPWPVARHGER